MTGADLEHWFAGSDAPGRTEGFAAAPDVICWQEAGDPLVLTYVPQWGWLLVCSLPLLLLGVFLSTLARQSYAGRPLRGLLVLADGRRPGSRGGGRLGLPANYLLRHRLWV